MGTKRALLPLMLAVAASPGFSAAQPKVNDGTMAYPGYCLTDWTGEERCQAGSDQPWLGPPLHPAYAQIVRATSGEGSAASGQGEHVCGAVLVAPDWALTASACVNRRSAKRGDGVRFGLPSTGGADGPHEGGLVRPILEVVRHPDARRGRRADLALVRFAAGDSVHIANPFFSPVLKTDNVRQAFGKTNYVFSRPAGTTFPPRGRPDVVFADASGRAGVGDYYNAVRIVWDHGAPADAERLIQEPVFTLPENLCDMQTDRGEADFKGTAICAISRHRPLCASDAGSPLFGGQSADGYEMLVVGIASVRSRRCAPEGKPDRYTPTGPYQDWIREVVKNSYDRRKDASEQVLYPDRPPRPE